MIPENDKETLISDLENEIKILKMKIKKKQLKAMKYHNALNVKIGKLLKVY